MAERKTPNKGYQKLKSDLSAGNIGQVYIFYGEESYLREYYLGEIKKKLVPAGFEEFNYHRLSGKTLTMQELNEAVEAMPMMAERTLVVVTDCDLFKLPEEQRAIFEANDWQIVEAAQPAHTEPPALCYSSVWLSMNCLVLDPKTVIVEASEVYQQEQMDKLGMNVIPCDLRDAYPFGGGLHCSTADVYREGECLDYFPNRVKDPTLVRPEMWND